MPETGGVPGDAVTLRAENARLRMLLEDKDAQIAALKTQNAELAERVARLERLISRNRETRRCRRALMTCRGRSRLSARPGGAVYERSRACSRCVAGGVVSQAPNRRSRQRAGGRHDHVPGTGLLIHEIEHKLDVTYVRRIPPTAFTQEKSQRYFKSILDWANEEHARTVRRIIGVHNEEMRKWAYKHWQDTRQISNYEARILEYEGKLDMLNMALIDERFRRERGASSVASQAPPQLPATIAG